MARCLAVILLLAAAAGGAVEEAGLVIDRVHGQGWQAQGVRLQLSLAGNAGLLQVKRIELPPPVGTLQDLRVRCAPLQLDDVALQCPRAQFQLRGKALDTPAFGGDFRYEFATQKLQFRVRDLPVGGTRIQMAAQQAGDAWRIQLDAPALSLSREDGTLASDKLALKLALRVRPVPVGWEFDLDLDAPKGQAYVEPVFVDFTDAPMQARLSGRWQSKARTLAVDTLHIEQRGSLRAQAALALDFAAERRLQSLQLRIDEAVLPGAYTRYLQPFLIGTVLDSLETQGRITGSVGFAAGRPRLVKLQLSELHLDDRKKRFALYGLDGDVNWQADPAVAGVTQLRWQGGSAYRLDLGAAALRLHTAGGDIRLLQPAKVPLLDGALEIRRFELGAAATPGMRVSFDGVLAPVGMERLSHALGWPVFGGTLSGTVPTLEYRDGNLTVGGTLAANVFDGRVEVDKLRLEQPFGALPRLAADLKIRNIDLEAATKTFSFGRITGRLNGDVKDLRLLKWRPVAFAGRLYTPPDDRSRHRISQRAIENISDLGGGGAAGVLSRGFLRFFEDFAYDRIALGCKLQDGVCQMSGLEPHRSGGYYIVKGSLVPRIDVIGFASRVSWDGLVEQLKSATKSEGPVIK
jgi:hypothetical protein